MNKIYELIGKAAVGLGVWALGVYSFYRLAIVVLDNCCTTIR